MNDFVHLHLHTEYSLLDGACRIKSLPEAVKKRGQHSVAITDHGNMYGVVDFYKSCKAADIKPIIGCECYTAKNSRFGKNPGEDAETGHLVLLASNDTGYKNLIYLASAAYTEGFYSKPRIDMELLENHNEGLIALSACLGGFIPQAIIRNDFDEAKAYTERLKAIFTKERFFLELQSHGIDGEPAINRKLIEIAGQLDIELVITNDVHYINKRDAEAQAVLMCIQTNRVISDGRPSGFEHDEFYLKDADEIRAAFDGYDTAVIEKAMANTVKIADMCEVAFDFSKFRLPEFTPPDGKSAAEYLTELTYKGLADKRLSGEAYNRRAEYELETIISMGYADYFLIVWDIIRVSRSRGIPVGPGRGSGAGSLVAYCIDICTINPLEYNLLFERFLNPERVSMPDFDIDLCQERRSEVIDYIIEKYGESHTAHIITFGTMAARGVIRDVGRAMGYSYREVDSIAKTVPNILNMTLERAFTISGDLRNSYNTNPVAKEIIDMAGNLEGFPRHASIHAAGIVITKEPVHEYVPVGIHSGTVVTQYSMNAVADLGLLKMDFLGLRYLTVIENTLRLIKKSEPDFDMEQIPLNDAGVFEMLSGGAADGVFQLESGGMKNLLISLKPAGIEDIVAAISLHRPGPMESIPRYLKNRHDNKNIEYGHPVLRSILEVTYGCVIYQEQVMQIFRELAGYSYGQADIVRRIMAKKKVSEMEKERSAFLNGCAGNNVPEEVAAEIFDIMSDFANYAFNKSHAAAYAVISYRTAYLKKYYTREYMASLLSSVQNDTGKITDYISECMRFGVRVYPPDVNYSGMGFTIWENGLIYGLLAIKNIGEGFIQNIMNERMNGKFTSFTDFISRMNKYEINKRQIEGLIKCGIFDRYGVYRSKLLASYENIIDGLNKQKNTNIEGQMDLFDCRTQLSSAGHSEIDYEYPNIPELDMSERLKLEKEAAGRFFSGHPLDEYNEAIRNLKVTDITKLISSFREDEYNNTSAYGEGSRITVAGLIGDVQIKRTKNNEDMAFLKIEDDYSAIEAVVFPKKLREYARHLETGNVMAIIGTISVREEEEPKLLLEKIIELEKNRNNSDKGAGTALYIRITDDRELDRIINLCGIFEGKYTVRVYNETTKKIYNIKAGIEFDDIFIDELKLMFGNENVRIKNKQGGRTKWGRG